MGPEVHQYPFVTVDEWSRVCESFVSACRRSIGEHCEADATSHHQQHGVDFVRITRTVERSSDGSADGEEQAADAISDCGGACEEDSDNEVAVVPRSQSKDGRSFIVTYDILLSTSYRVPVLHFTVRDMAGGPVTDLASVYADMIPTSFKDQVSGIGVIGAVSMTDHPLTGLPSFFVHPCNTADALRHVGGGRLVSVSEYLFLWMGIIAPAVGLSLPSTAFHGAHPAEPPNASGVGAGEH
ncbi:uncharacterized protein PV09_05581 [Verruconis gallopava]|uniref:Ubiquitin-like-conjugating enzyme ATG10 n=1 Tax=Verruconis gallopava TaxID=253628 RepID=A0A0D2A9E1_9PEZI|nr:uncharacterized protein PV09_05581 [Verruconis gallopava]KIW03373.1 hypothetical protein PV09_05581 [Verruconis gallopava]